MNTPSCRSRLVATLWAAMLAAQLDAATVFKENNATALNAAASWVGGVLPTASDTITWDDRLSSPVEGYFNQAVGGPLSVGGIKISNPPAPVQLNGDGRLTIGSAGIDLTSATQPMAILDVATLANTLQTWGTGGQALLLTGTVTRGANSFIKMDTSGGGYIQFPSTTTINTVYNYAVLNGTDFAGVGGDYRIVAGSTLGTYTPNVSAADPLMSGTYDVLDVVTSNTGANTVFRVNSAGLTANIRFGTAHETGLDWTANVPGGRNLNLSGRTILVTPTVGAHAVRFVGGGNMRLGSGATTVTFLNNNLAGNLVIENPINHSTSSASNIGSVVTAGLGTTVFAGANGYLGTTTIHGGTLQIGNGGTTGVLGAGNVINNSTLAFNRSDSVTVIHNISGTGAVTQAGAGETIFTTNVSTYSGPTNINAGTLTFTQLSNLGSGTAINFNGGALKWAAGNTLDLSASRTLTFNAGTATLNTNGNDVTIANSVGNGGAGGLAKAGAGTLTLAAANAYTGGTTVSGGVLNLAVSSGSATGSGDVSVVNGGTLAGTGAIAGAVSVASGGKLAPAGTGAGTLTAAGLTLAAGSVLDVHVASVGSYDRVVTTVSNGVTINGGGVNLYDAGGVNPLSTPGTYELVQFSGEVQGVGTSALSVLNKQAGYSYTFGANSTAITLLVELEAILSEWGLTGSGSWGSAASWGNGVPTTGYTAQFTTELAAPATVTLDGDRTINGAVFDSANGYTVAPGSGGTLILDKGARTVDINVISGDHVISAPVALASGMFVSTDEGASLTLSGVVSGLGGIAKSGPGTLNLYGHNTFAGALNITAGTLGFAHADSLGAGALSLDGSTLRYAEGNTADISGRAITIGANGVVIDTNGNDVIWLNAVGDGSTGTLTKTGAGILSLAAASTRSGDTILRGGALQIDGNDRLGAAAGSVIFDGGALASVGNISLQTVVDTVATNRSLVVGAAGGTISVPADTTLTVPGTITGAGTLAKDGAGILAIASTGNGTRTGGATVRDGTLHFSNSENFSVSDFIGSGTLTLEGGGLSSATASGRTLYVNVPVTIPAGKTASFATPNRFSITGAVTGAGTLNMSVNTNTNRADFSGNWSGFTGTLNLTGTGGIRLLNNGGGFNVGGFANTTLNAGAGLTLAVATNSGGNTVPIGALSGEATLSNSNGGVPTWQVGALNANTTFSGKFSARTNVSTDGLNTVTFTDNALTKVGTGIFTLTGDSMMTGAVTVSAGTLDVRGSIVAFYTSTGLDGVADDYRSLTEPTDGLPYTVTQPGAVTVAADGTLAGNGSLGGAITVNGRLQPDSTGLIGGKLTLTGLASLAYGANAVTQFDFSGASFTGVKSTSTGTVTYGGALKFNFLGTVFNGTYQVFELAAAPAGAFTSASVTTTANAETALTDVGAGVWEGTVGLQTYSFNSATGVLTVTGSPAGSPVTPAAATLTANPGSGVVGLTWSAASGADTYLVKRSTTTGTGYVTLAAAATGTSYNDTTVTNGVTYYYVVQGRNTASSLLGANSNEATATPAAAPSHTDLQNWRFDQFGVYDDDGTVLAGDNEDFDGDGLVNLMEYALGTNPTVANASPITVAKVGNVLTLTYPRRSPADPALAYSVLGSNDLVSGFTAGAGTTETVGSTSTYTDTADLSAAGSRRFLRLSVTYTAP